jgi:Secretion system C-terminal sorting domain/SprB repeat
MLSGFKKYFIALLLCLPFCGKAQGTISLSITGYDARCNGSTTGSAVAHVSGGVAPYSYVWMPAVGTTDSVGGLLAGTYTLAVTDSAGHTVTGFVTINQPAPLTVYIDSIVVMPCFRRMGGGVCGCNNTLWAVVSGGTAPYSYLWSPGGITTDTFKHACYIEYAVAVTDTNDCVTEDSIFVAIPPTTSGVAQHTASYGVGVYPNPASNQLTVDIAQSINDVRRVAVYDVAGNKVAERNVDGLEQVLSLDVSKLPNGAYFAEVIGDSFQDTVPFTVLR